MIPQMVWREDCERLAFFNKVLFSNETIFKSTAMVTLTIITCVINLKIIHIGKTHTHTHTRACVSVTNLTILPPFLWKLSVSRALKPNHSVPVLAESAYRSRYIIFRYTFLRLHKYRYDIVWELELHRHTCLTTSFFLLTQ